MNMIMQRLKIGIATASFLLLLLHHSATAQTQGADTLTSQISSGPAVTYTIQQCIDSALNNNLNVKTADFTARTAEVRNHRTMEDRINATSITMSHKDA